MTDKSQTVYANLVQATEWTSVRFTVLYEYPFWVGVLEVEAEGKLGAARHVFGVEPAAAEVVEFVRRLGVQLLEQAADAPVATDTNRTGSPRASSARRAARGMVRATSASGLSTETHEALQAQLDERSGRRRAAREAADRHRPEVAKHKLREKHRGR